MNGRKMPEWDGTGNKYEWILEQAKRLREERNGHAARPSRIPDLRLYVFGRLVDLPKVPIPDRTQAARAVIPRSSDVACIEQGARPTHAAVKKADA